MSALSSIPTANIDLIVIFNANSSGTVPDVSRDAQERPRAALQRLPPSTLFTLASASFGCGGSSPDRFWCPTGLARQNSLTQTNGPAYIGVYVKTHHTFITKMFGQHRSDHLTATAVLRLEPTIVSDLPRHRRGDAGARGDDGFILVTFGLFLTALMVIAALAIDVGGWYARAQLQRGADAAALAGVVWMPDFTAATTVAQTTAVEERLHERFEQHHGHGRDRRRQQP